MANDPVNALTKAVVLLSQYDHLLERKYERISDEVGAITDLVMHYMNEVTKVEEKQHPETMAALLKVLRVTENGVNNMESIHQEEVKLRDAMLKVYMDLAIDPAAHTLQ